MEALGLDLKTLIFQLINFGILLIVLTKLLHKPIKKLIEDRQREIEEGLKNAAKAKEQLAASEAAHQARLAQAEQEGRALLDGVKARATELEHQLSADAQAKAEKLLERTREELAHEKEQLKSELRGELASMVVVATEKVLASPIPDAEKRSHMKQLVEEIRE